MSAYEVTFEPGRLCLFCSRPLKKKRAWNENPARWVFAGAAGDGLFHTKTCGWRWAQMFMRHNPEYAINFHINLVNEKEKTT